MQTFVSCLPISGGKLSLLQSAVAALHVATRDYMAAKQTEELVKIRDSALFASRSLGYKKLKDLQLGVIKSFVGWKDVFAILPTG